MRAYLTRRYLFSASHRLHNDAMPENENQAVYGKCNNPHGHGHNYSLEITLGGQVDRATGMVCNLVDLDATVEREVLERYGHSNLNFLEEFATVVPTTENLCIHIFDRLRETFKPASIEKIRLEETMMNSFEYAGGAEPRH